MYMEDVSLDTEYDLERTVSVWEITPSIWTMTIWIWNISSLCPVSPTPHQYGEGTGEAMALTTSIIIHATSCHGQNILCRDGT